MDKLILIRNSVDIPTDYGVGKFYSFTGFPRDQEHVAIAFNNCMQNNYNYTPLIRIHSECLTGDIFKSRRCDCGNQLHEALQLFQNQEEGGILIYLRQEGRGIGLYNKLDAYKLQQEGLDTYEANRKLKFKEDLRDYSPAAQILKALNILKIKLMSNNPEKSQQLRNHGIEIEERIGTNCYIKAENVAYLKAKMKYGNHIFNIGEISND